MAVSAVHIQSMLMLTICPFSFQSMRKIRYNPSPKFSNHIPDSGTGTFQALRSPSGVERIVILESVYLNDH